MTICKHLEWLQVVTGEETVLINPGRLARIVKKLPDAADQFPSVLLFVGRRAKLQALRELFPSHIKKGRHDSVATLRVDNTSLYSRHPIFFADSEPYTKIIPSPVTSCHDLESFPLRWATPGTVHDVYDILHTRILLPFSDVLCMFAEDFTTFDEVIDRLKSWAVTGKPARVLDQPRPRVVIVKRSDGAGASPTYDLLEMQDIQMSLDHSVLRESFSSIKVLSLADEQISPLARFRRLKELLWRQMDEMRNARVRLRSLYSAIHMTKLFHLAVSHTATSTSRPFDFVVASRLGYEPNPHQTYHLASFLRVGLDHGADLDTLVRFVASTLLLDAYPPGMHRE